MRQCQWKEVKVSVNETDYRFDGSSAKRKAAIIWSERVCVEDVLPHPNRK